MTGISLKKIEDDIDFAFANYNEFRGLCPLMRYVVALNPEMTVAEWLQVARARGWNVHTARGEFRKSRRCFAEVDAWERATNMRAAGIQ